VAATRLRKCVLLCAVPWERFGVGSGVVVGGGIKALTGGGVGCVGAGDDVVRAGGIIGVVGIIGMVGITATQQ